MPDAREQAEAVAKWMGLIWRSCEFETLPPYATSLDAMREVEDEIERRGLMGKYADALIGDRELHTEREVEHFLIRATPAQRLAAAARVIEEVGKQ